MFKRSVVPNIKSVLHQQVDCIILVSQRLGSLFLPRRFCETKREFLPLRSVNFSLRGLRFFFRDFAFRTRANFRGNVTLLIPTPTKRLFRSLLIFGELVFTGRSCGWSNIYGFTFSSLLSLSLSLVFSLYFFFFGEWRPTNETWNFNDY